MMWRSPRGLPRGRPEGPGYMVSNLKNLFRYRGLISSRVARELKARYRGSALGFVWSFINPLLLLLIYSFVFTTVMPNTTEGVQPYQLFMFCGILPWTWFSSSLSEAANSLIAGGNLFRYRGLIQSLVARELKARY